MKVEKLWQDNKKNFMSRVSEIDNDKELIATYQMLLEQLKTGIISYYQHEVYLRQMIILLFQEASQASEILLAKGHPTLEFQNDHKENNNNNNNNNSVFVRVLLNPIISYVVLAAGFIFSIIVGMNKMPFSGYCACFFAASLALIIYQNTTSAKKQDVQMPIVKTALKADYLEGFITRQVQLLDQHISDCQNLIESITEILPDNMKDTNVMELCQYVWAMANDSYPKETVLFKAESILEKNGVSWIEFSEEKRGYFDVMPTKQSARMVFPAIENRDGTLLVKGQYLKPSA